MPTKKKKKLKKREAASYIARDEQERRVQFLITHWTNLALSLSNVKSRKEPKRDPVAKEYRDSIKQAPVGLISYGNRIDPIIGTN